MSHFLTTINNFYRECFPLKTKFVTEKYFRNPWHNSSVKKLSDVRARYFSLFKQGLVSRNEYTTFRNRVTGLIRKHKQTYFQNLFSRNMNNIKTTWKNIKLLCQNNQTKNIESIFYNNTNYTSDKDKAEIFNDFFVNIARNIENSLPATTTSPYCAMNPNNLPPININPCTFEEVSTIISSLKNTKTDKEHISVPIFKSYRNYFIPSLCNIINMSFEYGIFPDSLKHATVIPIYKKLDRKNVSNYRPISLLPFISKIFEKCIYNRLVDYASVCNIFPPNQYGFRKGRSTQDAIIALTHCERSEA